ncbi:hypothetical protein V6Z12_A04G036800 [Gossypium hirsutum]
MASSILKFTCIIMSRDLNCGRGRIFGRIAFIAVADITDAIAVIAGFSSANRFLLDQTNHAHKNMDPVVHEPMKNPSDEKLGVGYGVGSGSGNGMGYGIEDGNQLGTATGYGAGNNMGYGIGYGTGNGNQLGTGIGYGTGNGNQLGNGIGFGIGNGGQSGNSVGYGVGIGSGGNNWNGPGTGIGIGSGSGGLGSGIGVGYGSGGVPACTTGNCKLLNGPGNCVPVRPAHYELQGRSAAGAAKEMSRTMSTVTQP